MIPYVCGFLSRARKIELLADVTSQLSMGTAGSFKGAGLHEGVESPAGGECSEHLQEQSGIFFSLSEVIYMPCTS